MWARHASPLRIGGLENAPSVKFQLKIQSVVIREIRGSFSITITIFGHTQWATHASPLRIGVDRRLLWNPVGVRSYG